MYNKFLELLYCPDCCSVLEDRGQFLKCVRCGREYRKEGGKVFFREIGFNDNEGQDTDSIIFKAKKALRKYPKLFEFVYHIVYPSTGKSSKQFVESLSRDAIILNVGSGVLKIDERVIDLDYMPYPNVSVVADARRLPFKDESIDALISDALLEHMKSPKEVVSEMRRVLKPRGQIYVLVPFIFSFHSSPDDYYRWTASGLEELLKGFRKEETGVRYGPTSAMTTIVREWLSIVLSFGVGTLYQIWNLIFLIVFTPINWLDFVFSRYRFSSNIANGLYFIGNKR
ncbi:MAG TPA: class I SAM-dependent methyltransferase [Candidatus Paceibacterota bacterium]